MKVPGRLFVVFQRECRRLEALWKITDWDLRVKFEKPMNDGALASCWPRSVKRVVIVRLNPENGITNEREARVCARHEMVHVLLGEFSCLAGSRYVTSDEMESAEEAIVQRLIRLLP